MVSAFRYFDAFSFLQDYIPFFHLDFYLAANNEKQLVFFIMPVPMIAAVEFCDPDNAVADDLNVFRVPWFTDFFRDQIQVEFFECHYNGLHYNCAGLTCLLAFFLTTAGLP